MTSPGEHADEISRGERFQFGANWQAFLATLDEDRIAEADSSLRTMLGVETLSGKRFLDIGSGSGLFSLAARGLGAEVISFDFDPQSVACTTELKRRFFSDDEQWQILHGSALDAEFLGELGRFDVVYSWGVLHHTGQMWQGLENALVPVAEEGQLFIAIYNDEGGLSQFWTAVKRYYCANFAGRWLMTGLFVPWFFGRSMAVSLIRHRNPWGFFRQYRKQRGMSPWYDWIDWIGGYPFEVARPEEIFDFYRSRGLTLERLVTTNRSGCNQFVFRRTASVGIHRQS